MKKPTKKSSLHFQSHVYEDQGKAPCPIPGGEDGLCKTTYKGKPAWWKEGHIYVLVSSSEPESRFDWFKRLLDRVPGARNQLKMKSKIKT